MNGTGTADLVQEVLAIFIAKLREFEYDRLQQQPYFLAGGPFQQKGHFFSILQITTRSVVPHAVLIFNLCLLPS